MISAAIMKSAMKTAIPACITCWSTVKVEDSDFLKRRDERARVLGDVEGVGLEQQPPLDVDREIVAETEDEVLARPGELQPNRAGHQCQDMKRPAAAIRR